MRAHKDLKREILLQCGNSSEQRRQHGALPARMKVRLRLVEQHDDTVLGLLAQKLGRARMSLPRPHEEVREHQHALHASGRERDRHIAIGQRQCRVLATIV
jgi:hypothetical protein